MDKIQKPVNTGDWGDQSQQGPYDEHGDAHIRSASPNAHFIVLTTYQGDVQALRALRQELLDIRSE
jgi:hypothetical protein